MPLIPRNRFGRSLVALGSAASVGGIGALGISSYFVRQVVSPGEPVDDAAVLAARDDTIDLVATAESTAPGRYGIWQDGWSTHARLGDVIAVHGEVVTRRLEGVDFGELRVGPARLNGHFYPGPPGDLPGAQLESLMLSGVLGNLPAWRVSGGDRWAILVHGRGAVRSEGLRAVRVLQELGMTVLLPSYRNDPDAVPSPDGRYNLGLTEWQDIDTAIEFAIAHGASDIVLFGWSMGGAIVLQTLARSAHAHRVSQIVLDAPVVDWGAVIDFQARLHHLPVPFSRLGQRLLRNPLGKKLAGLHEPIRIAQTNWIARADELHTPTLLIHSRDDDFVPYAPSAALAARRPDLIRLESWDVARHCREWNVDPERWNAVVRDVLMPAPSAP